MSYNNKRLCVIGLASADPNFSKRTNPHVENFKKYLTRAKKRERSILDLNSDGKPECKREFFAGTKKISKEICDYNHDGIADLKTKMNEDRLTLL